MKTIWFKYKYHDQIVSGEKTQTIRLWKKNMNFKATDTFECFFGNKNKNKLYCEITKISKKSVLQLNSDEIKKDGFKNKLELILELKKYYPEYKEIDLMTVIEFKVKKI